MFDELGIERLKNSSYEILRLNYHDTTIHSQRTGHDWIIISYYDSSECYILHRHSRREPYHRQKGNYRSLKDALKYISGHEEWFAKYKLNKE